MVQLATQLCSPEDAAAPAPPPHIEPHYISTLIKISLIWAPLVQASQEGVKKERVGDERELEAQKRRRSIDGL